ncbi:protein FAR1-RELATED SEQUENCE 5-like [Salvia hispanica]|uniref:protein FAR1-RELATED SEQUENCE 5-like n=1 Tax=Salvia hispanica TaxID=49212 RepID=UPI0020094DB3|nr:protein FAR1-RELATED SEQUENCE 5-like [Salvia hispanica]
MEEVFVIPECSPQLKPVIAQKFQSLDFAFAFYDVYAHAVGFDTRKQGMRKAADGVTTWYSVVCNREGCKRSNEEDDVNARSGFTLKRRRLSKRCGCKACISFKYFSEAGIPGYIIHEFNEVHNHCMVESEHQQFMTLNRKLNDVHHKFILDCSKANIGLTLTFKVLKEILGGFELVGCNVGDIRNTSRDIKAFAHGCDVQMVLDDMAKKKELSDAFTYHYEVNAANKLVALFWCDGLMKRNYHMFGDIVAFDSTYNTNRHCMIFTPFMGKDSHGKPVTFAAGLVCNEKTGAFAWLFKHFVECMGVAPKMIVTDQDLGMRSAIQEDLLEPDKFEEEWNGVIEHYELEDVDWLNTLYEYRQMWIPAYFRDFPLGSMIRTTSISESENSFYKNFMKPRANLAELYLYSNNALDFQRNARTKLDYNDATSVPILATKLGFEKHAATIYTDSMFRKIQEEIVDGNVRCRVLGFSSTDMIDTYKLGDSRRNSNNEVSKIPEMYCNSRWMKTPLAKAVHGLFDVTVDTRSTVDDRQTVTNQGISLFYAGTPPTSAFEKRRMIEEFYGMPRPEVVEVHPPDVVKTKGHASSSASRLVSKREKAIKEAARPLRRCKACDELGHHDSRNCLMLNEMEKEKALSKGKRKA